MRSQLSDAGEAFSASVREKWEDWLQKACCTDQGGSATLMASKAEGDAEYSSDGDSFFSDHWDDTEEKDFTACGADSCGYCGRCSY